MCRTHEDAIYWTRLNTQSAKHALRIVDRVSRNFEALPTFDPLLANVDAIDRAGFGTLITRDTGRQIKSMKAAITRGDRNRLLRVFELVRERAAICFVGDQPITQRHPHSVTDRIDRHADISKPIQHQMRPRKFAAWKPALIIGSVLNSASAVQAPFAEAFRTIDAHDECQVRQRTRRC